ncbi:MAG: AMMECR1 domain-containing protein [Patescibacteria group bacterium]
MTGGKYARLSEAAARQYVLHQRMLPLPASLAPDLKRQQACYITVYEDPGQRFRSIYGTPLPTSSCLAQEIINNTTQALARESHRVVRQADLNDLHFEVAILGPLERIGGPEHLDIRRYGVYVRSDRGKSSVVLPHRVGVETAEEQFATVLRESGINPRHEAHTFYRFTVAYHT